MQLKTVLIAALVGVGTLPSAYAQTLPMVRVVSQDAVVYASRNQRHRIIAAPAEGTEIEALGARDGWIWVLLGPDLDGTRYPGWIELRYVEIPTTGAAGYSMRGVAAELEAERATSEARLAEAQAELEAKRAASEARLAEARGRLEKARDEYRQVSGSPPAPDDNGGQPKQ